jgi:hypothetical protein
VIQISEGIVGKNAFEISLPFVKEEIRKVGAFHSIFSQDKKPRSRDFIKI